METRPLIALSTLAALLGCGGQNNPTKPPVFVQNVPPIPGSGTMKHEEFRTETGINPKFWRDENGKITPVDNQGKIVPNEDPKIF